MEPSAEPTAEPYLGAAHRTALGAAPCRVWLWQVGSTKAIYGGTVTLTLDDPLHQRVIFVHVHGMRHIDDFDGDAGPYCCHCHGPLCHYGESSAYGSTHDASALLDLIQKDALWARTP